MHPLMVATFTAGAFLNACTALRCLQGKVLRALGNLKPLVTFVHFLNITTIGVLLFVFTSQESVSSNWTSACVVGPTVAQLCFSLLFLGQTISAGVTFLIKSKGWRFSVKQVFLILTLAVVASGLLLTPAIWAAANNTPLVTSIQCVDKVDLNSGDVINRELYLLFLCVLQFDVPGILLSVMLWWQVKPYIIQKATSSVGKKRRLFYVVVDVVVISLTMISWVLMFYVHGEKGFIKVIVLPAELCFIAVLSPLFLLCLIESELAWTAERKQLTDSTELTT